MGLKPSNLVDIYRQFWRAGDQDEWKDIRQTFPGGNRRQSILPVIVALDTLRDADRKLFPDRESLAEAVAGAVMEISKEDEGILPEAIPYIRQFADMIVDAFAFAISDPGAITRPLRQLVEDACAVLYQEKAKADDYQYMSVTQFANLHGVTRDYIKQEIRRRNLKARAIGNQYVLSVQENQAWIDNPRRGSRGKEAAHEAVG